MIDALISSRLERRARARGQTDVFGLGPEELDGLGLGVSGRAAFTELQRPWRWSPAGPALAATVERRLAAHGSRLPEIVARCPSQDGSTKLVLAYGADRVECVHMPRAVGVGRVTLCLSSQVGCGMGCGFCATSSMGFLRHLSAGEMVAQVLVVLRALGPRHPGLLTLVFMGMGEPLHNLQEVLGAVRILCRSEGLGLSPRRITLSTSGLVPALGELGTAAVRPRLAVSLNATTDQLRSQLMPINRRYPLSVLRRALERYPRRRRERTIIEYVLLRDLNDSSDDAARLSDFCATFPHHVNLIPYNPHHRSAYRPPDEARVDAFARALLDRAPTLVTVRRSRGADVQGACGQLVQLPLPGRG